MIVNIDKCKCLHIGHGNIRTSYQLGGTYVPTATQKKELVRPHIEYCVLDWRSYYQKDVDNLEKIQRRATRMMEELIGMEYEERLRQTRLFTLEARRTRADITEVFKIMK